MAEDWSCLDEYLLAYVADPSQRATVFASSFAAALELVREGADGAEPERGVRAALFPQARAATDRRGAAPDCDL